MFVLLVSSCLISVILNYCSYEEVAGCFSEFYSVFKTSALIVEFSEVDLDIVELSMVFYSCSLIGPHIGGSETASTDEVDPLT